MNDNSNIFSVDSIGSVGTFNRLGQNIIIQPHKRDMEFFATRSSPYKL